MTLFVLRAREIKNGIFRRSSFINATPAEFVAMSEPLKPIATPTSAVARIGPSLIPSPTTRVLCPRLMRYFSSSCFSSGKHSASIASTPTACATRFATSRRSPVKMETCRTPCLRISSTASAACGRSLSSRPTAPKYCVPRMRCTLDMPSIFSETVFTCSAMDLFKLSSQAPRPA